MLSKREIRNIVIEKRKKLKASQIERSGDVLLNKITESGLLNGKTNIFVYISSKNEVSTVKLIEYMLKNGMNVYAPRVTGNMTMEAVRINDLNEDTAEGNFGIYEPTGKDAICPDDIDAVFVPGTAFDNEGNRIGYGGGYYDRYFSNVMNLESLLKIGICYDFQMVDKIISEEHDIKMDCIITIDDV